MQDCVFCRKNGLLEARQILTEGRHAYICAPCGPVAMGVLLICTRACVPAMSRAAPEVLQELEAHLDRVDQFYRTRLGVRDWVFYEQARGGGGLRRDRASGFPLHAHLCCVPRDLALHEHLAAGLAAQPLRALHDLADSGVNQAYILVGRQGRCTLYTARTVNKQRQLEASRLRDVLVELLGAPDRRSWRKHQDDAEVAALIKEWTEHDREAYPEPRRD